MAVNSEKCEFNKMRLHFWGHLFLAEGIKLNQTLKGVCRLRILLLPSAVDSFHAVPLLLMHYRLSSCHIISQRINKILHLNSIIGKIQ